MLHIEFTKQSPDNLPVYFQGWQPETPPKAVVCLVHGMGEHSGRYAHVAAALNDAGYAVLGLDLRGHGKSGGPRGHTPSYDALWEGFYHETHNEPEKAEVLGFMIDWLKRHV